MGIQTRQLIDRVIQELTIRNVEPEKARKLAHDLINNFLNHNTAKAPKNEDAAAVDVPNTDKDTKPKKGKGKKEKKENSNDSEVVRIFPEESREIDQAAADLASGKIDDPKKVKFTHTGVALAIALFGRMRPTFIPGALSVGEAIGIERLTNEEDFFTARDDYNKEDFYKKDPGAFAHSGTRHLASSTMYQNYQINIPLLLKNLNFDGDLAEDTLGQFLNAVYEAGPSSGSTNGAHTHTLTGYLMVEKLTSEPRSLEPAFEQPVTSLAEGVKRLQALKACYDKEIPAAFVEFAAYFNDAGELVDKGTLDNLREFIKKTLQEATEN
jgi:hypothetical protein